MEMHFIDKSAVQEIVSANKCRILEIVETDFCGDHIKNCIYVIGKNDRD
jgi:hypothetical protein